MSNTIVDVSFPDEEDDTSQATTVAVAVDASDATTGSGTPAELTRHQPDTLTCTTTTTTSSREDAADEIASLKAHIADLTAENAVLRSGSVSGGGLSMAFKLLDGLKLERDALKIEVADLRARIARGGVGTPLERLLAHEELSPATRSAILTLPQDTQHILAKDLERWNLKQPTDAHGNPYDVNRRAMHIAKKLSSAPHGAKPVTAADPASSPADSPSATPLPDSSISPSSFPPLDSPPLPTVDAPRRKRLVVAKSLNEPSNTFPNTQLQGSASDDEETFSPKTATEAEQIDHSHLSTSLLSDTNRLIFQEDSPLYRQQLQLQRVRVAQFFTRLDHLAEGTERFASATLAFSQAATEWAQLLGKKWDDVEAREVIDEAQSVKLDAKLKEEAAKANANTTQQTNGASGSGANGTTTSAQSAATSTALPTSSSSSPQLSHVPRASINLNPTSMSLLLPVVGPSSKMLPPAGRGSPLRGPAPAPVGSPPPTARQSSAEAAHSHTLPPGVDSISLGFSLGKLSSLVHTMCAASSNLSQFLSHILLTGLTSIGETYRSEAKSTMLRMERIMEEYEEKLSVYLKKRQKDRLKILNMKNIFGKKKMIDEEHMYICALRREMELRRLDHVEVLNTILTQRRLELVEIASASFISFLTFFHECDFSANELKVDIDCVQQSLPRRRRFYDQHREEVTTLREQIKTSALPMNLAKVFSAAPSLPIGMNATDWLQNISLPSYAGAGAAPTTQTTANSTPPSANSPPTPSKADASHNATPSPAPVGSGEKYGGGVQNIGHASLIYTIPGIGVASSLSKPAQVQGYLRTLTRDGKAWKRRWHVLEKGQFFYLRESAFLQPRFIVNVLTCGARPCVKSDMDFMFELISPTKTILYQAESEHEMRTWVAVFANSTEYLLGLQQTRNDTEALTKNMDIKTLQLQKHLKQGLLTTLRKANQHCAECGHKDPDWISINIGVMICIVCSGIHRSLGVHVSKVRSIVLDDLDTELLDMMVSLGNTRMNALWEGGLPSASASGANANADANHASPTFHRPTPGAGREQKEEFIQAKYVKKQWLAPHIVEGAAAALKLPVDDRYQPLLKACETDDLESVVVCLLQGCDVDWRNPGDHGKTPLHHAAAFDSILVCEYLIQNNANAAAEDAQHRTPLDSAREASAARAIARLQGATSKTKH